MCKSDNFVSLNNTNFAYPRSKKQTNIFSLGKFHKNPKKSGVLRSFCAVFVRSVFAIFTTGCIKPTPSEDGVGLQSVKKASQSSPRVRRIESKSVFDRGVYVGENTSQAASVRVVRQRRTRSARSRLQNTGGKPRKGFFDKFKRLPQNEGAVVFMPDRWPCRPSGTYSSPALRSAPGERACSARGHRHRR